MAARIIGLSSLILAASLISLISRTQAQYPCKEDEGWLAEEDAECSGTDQTSCTEALCCEARTCASVESTTGLACPTGTTAKESPETIGLSACNGQSGNDELACVAQRCCDDMTCANIGTALNLECPADKAESEAAADIVVTDPDEWYSTCCDLDTCATLRSACVNSDVECTCPEGYTNVGSVFNDQLGSGSVADKFWEQCCELPTCVNSEGPGDDGCPDGKRAKAGTAYNSGLSGVEFSEQCCRWETCSEAAVADCDDGYELSPSQEWSTVDGDDDAFKDACCVLKSCTAVAAANGNVACDGDDIFKPDQYDSSGEGDFDEEAFKTKCCGPEVKCEDYKEESGLIDGGLRTAYPGIVAAALVGAVVSWGSWAAGSAAS